MVAAFARPEPHRLVELMEWAVPKSNGNVEVLSVQESWVIRGVEIFPFTRRSLTYEMYNTWIIIPGFLEARVCGKREKEREM